MRAPAAGSLAALAAAAAPLASRTRSRTCTCLLTSLVVAPLTESAAATAPALQPPAAAAGGSGGCGLVDMWRHSDTAAAGASDWTRVGACGGGGDISHLPAALATPLATTAAAAALRPWGPASRQSGNPHGPPPSGAASPPAMLSASSPGLRACMPYEYGTERCRRSRGWRAVASRWGATAAQRRYHDGVWAAAAAPLAPFAVRHLHGSRGGGGDGDEVLGPAADGGRASVPPYRAAPREEGLGAPMDVFDRPLKSLHRDRSAALLDCSDPLLVAVSERLLDRLEDCRRGFPTAVVLGGAALPALQQLAGGRAGIERVVVVDTSQRMLDRVQREEAEARSRPGSKPWPRVVCVRGDEEHLPLQPKSVDLIISCLGLHWANDLPGAMAQCRMALAPDGLFLGAVLGGDTLQELRIACALAQMEREGGVSAVVSPLAQVRDAGNLLTRADLRLPAVDVDRFHIGYPSPLELVQHLRALGESNAALRRRRSLSRDSALAAAAVYQSMFGSGEEGGSSVSATFEVIFMTGWAPAANQPKAAKRGSATVSFQDLADGLVKGGAAVGGTAEDGVLTQPEPGAGTPPSSSSEPSPSS
ncbi:hypothetical protein PLESTB_000209200 [Pleodorina starrii]|uniref:Methyltransferase type 11 domain-containing protein n=1 Tax=Pleodorina starrii TaxID=330485 RepID=A0A9W6BBY1_9CHLO|nr:hypothetical protein PLESTM_000322300 [Pleodorina starrii]GLC49344.1 hypothetical protein PLESTB_000209200 [Pleodorina starrii]GLC73396.1 hypothetical protein PLESTF_001370800 [Pleodorina starrii]